MNRRNFLHTIASVTAVSGLVSCRSPKKEELWVIPRSAWSPIDSTKKTDASSIGRITRITIHHDGIDPPAVLRSSEDVKAHLLKIRGYHLSRGWVDIGYHFIVDPFGQVWKGRPLGWQGAHVSGQNEGNVGILILGNFQKQYPSQKALDSAHELVIRLRGRYGIPRNQVFTHRELNKTTECPGDHLQEAINHVR